MDKSRWNSPMLIMPVLLVLWGSYAAVSKLATNRLDSFQVLFYTFGISCLMFTIMLIANGRIKSVLSLTLRDWVRLLATGLPFYLYYLLYSLSMNRIPVVEASMLNYLFPVFIVLLSIPLFGERLSLVKGLSILFAFIGMLLIVSNGHLAGIRLSNLGGDSLALAAALSWALFSVIGKKNQAEQDLAIYLYTIGAFALSAIGMFGFSSLAIPDAASIGMEVWLALSNIVFGNLLWFRALKTYSSSLVAGVSYLSPFATLLFIVLMLGEKMSLAQMSGFLVILAGLAIQWVPVSSVLAAKSR